MTDKPAVLFTVLKSGFRSDLQWGPAILVRALCEGLLRSGHPVTRLVPAGQRIVLKTLSASPTKPQSAPLQWTGSRWFMWIESAVRGLQSRLGLPYFGFFDNLRAYDACRAGLLEQFDVCHEYYTLFGIGALLACRAKGVPHILHVDADLVHESELAGAPLRGLQKAYAIRLARYLFRHTSRMVCVSEAARDHFVQHWRVPANHIAVLPNGVEESFFEDDKQPDRRPDRPEGETVVVFVGSFQPWHGLDLILDSFSQLRVECPDTKLLLIGDGPMRPAIEERISRLGLAGAVRLVGQQPHASIPGWLQQADIALATYSKQPHELWFSPLKLYEYMAAGVALIATNAGQIKEVIRPDVDGILIEPGDSEALAGAMIALVRDPEKRRQLSSSASRKARSDHTWDAVIRKLEGIYQESIP